MYKVPLITVITVCLNAGDELEKTVKSVLNQDYNSYEYIIKDGLSNDGSIEKVPKDPRIKIIRQNDDGIFDAMNQALYISKGKLINFLNAGDIFYKKNILKTVDKYQDENPNVDLFYGDYINSSSNIKYFKTPNKIYKHYLFSGTICHQTWFLSRSVQLNYGGYCTKFKTGGDYFMLLDLIFKEQIKYKKINKILVKYKGGGISSEISNVKSSLKAREEKRKEICSKPEYYLFYLIRIVKKILRLIIYNYPFYIIVKKHRKNKYEN